MAVDLHIHTIFSDGTMTPREIVGHAKKNRLKAIAITDHDTLSGIKEALLYGVQFGVNIVPGIEISIENPLSKENHLHLIGLFINQQASHLKKILGYLRQHRKKRMREIIVKLNKIGIDIAVDEIYNNNQTSYGRLHIANLLLKKKYVSSIREAFDKYLKKGSPGFVESMKLNAQEGINCIKNAGGLAILAHPLSPNSELKSDVLRTIIKLRKLGLDGIEGYYPSYNKQSIQWLLNIAKTNHLIISGGSDFHGENTPDIKIGKMKGSKSIPDSIYFDLCKYYKFKDINKGGF
jgi:predicted metal-dependent phosphoesterase TrpH